MDIDRPTASDEELARQTQAGSLAAFDELVARYEARLYRFARQFCRAEADAQEAVQEAFVRAFQAIEKFDCRRSFAPWLFTIARRKCVDLHRAALPVADQASAELPGPETPAELLEHREEEQNLWRLARRLLPELQYQALWLRYAEEMNVAR